MLMYDLPMNVPHKQEASTEKQIPPPMTANTPTGTEHRFLEKPSTSGRSSTNKLAALWLMGKSHLPCCDRQKTIIWLRKLPRLTHMMLPKRSHRLREEDWDPLLLFHFLCRCAIFISHLHHSRLVSLFTKGRHSKLPVFYLIYKKKIWLNITHQTRWE